jgi:hypothetical protein
MRCSLPGNSTPETNRRHVRRRPGGQRGQRLARRGSGGSEHGGGLHRGHARRRCPLGTARKHAYRRFRHDGVRVRCGPRHSEPTSLVFQIPPAGLTVKVHQRVNVRVLELIDNASDARIELEGNRLPLTHSKDVIHILGNASPGHQPDGPG